jgi:hypothetical protein
MTPATFVRVLCALDFEHTFNPYAERCPVHDVHDAAQIRARILRSMLEVAVQVEIDSIWIGRDLGYKGGRRTGLALTDDVHLASHGMRWGVAIDRPTQGRVVAERTAAVIWSVLSLIEGGVFLWNVFPLHPHEPNDPFSNRSHNARERQAGEDILTSLMVMLRPRRLVAIGSNAAETARRIASAREAVWGVRHPSYGGQSIFLQQIRRLYGLDAQSAWTQPTLM